jgi:hypothetical protein
MSFIGDAIGDVFGGITGAKQAGQAAERAGQLQSQMYGKGIDEQKRQFDALIKLMQPYVSGGQTAFDQQQALIGLKGAPAQQQAMAGFESSPLFQSLTQQGENAILQNASATGGLRGGNVQGALSQFRPQVLNQLIEQQYGRLGGLSQLGQASAAGQASQGMQLASNIGNLYGNQGQALGQGMIARGGVARNTIGDLLGIAQGAASMGFNPFGGAKPTGLMRTG